MRPLGLPHPCLPGHRPHRRHGTGAPWSHSLAWPVSGYRAKVLQSGVRCCPRAAPSLSQSLGAATLLPGQKRRRRRCGGELLRPPSPPPALADELAAPGHVYMQPLPALALLPGRRHLLCPHPTARAPYLIPLPLCSPGPHSSCCDIASSPTLSGTLLPLCFCTLPAAAERAASRPACNPPGSVQICVLLPAPLIL